MGLPQKTAWFFWVSTRASEPCDKVNFVEHREIVCLSVLQECTVHRERRHRVLSHSQAVSRGTQQEDDSAQIFPQLHVRTSVEGKHACDTMSIC